MKIVLGTRGSELAKTQAALVAAALHAARPELEIKTRIIVTSGDEQVSPARAVVDRHAGRKGLFTREIERALAAGEIDVAVHSAKDLPSEMNEGLAIGATLPRAGVQDVLISKSGRGLEALPQGSSVGTGSVRREFQLRWQRPDLQTFDLRGNVPTRLRKLQENSWGAIVLARAGLERLGHSPAQKEILFNEQLFGAEILDTGIFLPAGGQGVIALQVRSGDAAVSSVVSGINDDATLSCLRAEREFLRLLKGDCDTPVGVLAEIESEMMKLRTQVFDDGVIAPRTAVVQGSADSPEELAMQLWEKING